MGEPRYRRTRIAERAVAVVDVDSARDEQRTVVRAPEPISEGDISAREVHGARKIVNWVVAPERSIEMIERILRTSGSHYEHPTFVPIVPSVRCCRR